MSFRDHPDFVYGKYTRWAKDMTDDELVGLLWMIGEYAIRSSPTEHEIHQRQSIGERRRLGALNSIVRFQQGKRFTVADVRAGCRICCVGPGAPDGHAEGCPGKKFDEAVPVKSP
jgi:hypothetical protein